MENRKILAQIETEIKVVEGEAERQLRTLIEMAREMSSTGEYIEKLINEKGYAELQNLPEGDGTEQWFVTRGADFESRASFYGIERVKLNNMRELLKKVQD